jgi:hypothetical protein
MRLPLTVLGGLALLGVVAAFAQDAATIKLLPTEKQGKGLAAKFPGDKGIARHESVIFADGFERDDLAKVWSEVKRMPGQVSYSTSEAEVHTGKRAIRIDRKPGENNGGHLYKLLPKGEDRLHLRFYVKFPKDHGYVHHFVHLCGYRPGTKWPQGGAGDRPKGDERFSTGIDLYGDWGRIKPPGRWGLYSYWCEMQGSRGKFWGNEPKGGKQVPVTRDRWISVEVMMKMNTVGEQDGEQAFWIDGKCAGRWGGYRWHTNEELKVNAVWLLYYITDEAVRRQQGEPKPEHVFFDDIVVAREYIGPQRD